MRDHAAGRQHDALVGADEARRIDRHAAALQAGVACSRDSWNGRSRSSARNCGWSTSQPLVELMVARSRRGSTPSNDEVEVGRRRLGASITTIGRRLLPLG
jgi:hypothetical protein